MIYRIDQTTDISSKNSLVIEALKKARAPLGIDFILEGRIFIFLIPTIIDYCGEYGSIYIASLIVEGVHVRIITKSNIQSEKRIHIHSPTLVTFSLPEFLTIYLDSMLICLSDAKGCVILRDPKSVLLSKSLEKAHIINDCGNYKNVSGRNRIIRFNQRVN